MSGSILEIRHLNSFYEEDLTDFRHDDKQQVLRDVSFEIREGDILGLVGESGSGKTTLAKVILGIVTDYNGEVIHHTKYPQMVFQDPFSSLNPARPVGWILEEPLRALEKLSVPDPLRNKITKIVKAHYSYHLGIDSLKSESLII